MEEAKDIHTSLRKAAGLINFVKDTLVPQLSGKTLDGSDLDVRVIAAYLNQCTAEAQEVTIARSVSYEIRITKDKYILVFVFFIELSS